LKFEYDEQQYAYITTCRDWWEHWKGVFVVLGEGGDCNVEISRFL